MCISLAASLLQSIRASTSMFFVMCLLSLPHNILNVATATATASNNDVYRSEDRIRLVEESSALLLKDTILEAKSLLVYLGVPEMNLCRSGDNTKLTISMATNQEEEEEDYNYLWYLPICNDDNNQHRNIPNNIESNGSTNSDDETTRILRILEEEEEEEEPTFEEDPWFYITMGLCAVGCVMTAALAAGLTMGMLSIDPLMLLVKIRASRSQEEKKQAEALLPIVKQHHLLLVTLLLLNSMANEALPLFLEVLVSPVVSVILSVSFVLIFGEILPSAIFTGPKKLKLASNMVPIVKIVMCLCYPISYPIAKVLDKFLHDDDGDDGGAFDRGEISALVRIQYEERIANKRQRKLERMSTVRLGDSSAKFPHPKKRPHDLVLALKVAKSASFRNIPEESADFSDMDDVQSIHVDEVTMVEGALQMKTKIAMNHFTPIHRMFAVPENLILNEDNVVDIYSSGYSRIPVYEQNPLTPKSQTAIKGILLTKHLIVVNMNEDRPLLTMPLLIPPCVSPKMNLVELVNLFQTGKSGHFALVCARPSAGNTALRNGNAIPATAGVMGVITLEDVLEELLQEEIYDENDQMEKEAEKIAYWVGRKWKRLKRRREQEAAGEPERLSMASLVVDAINASQIDNNFNATNESTSLLQKNEGTRRNGSGLLGSIFQSLGMNKNDSS